MNRAKAPAKASKKSSAKAATSSSNGSKAMSGKATAGKAGIKALLTAFRGKSKAAPAPNGKSKPQAAKPVKAAAKGKAPAAPVAKAKKAAAPAKPVAAKVVATKPQKAAPAPKVAAPAKNHGKNGSAAVAVKAVAPLQVKGKGAQGKNSAAFAAAAAVQKMTSRLSGRSLEASTDAVCREVACEGLGTTAGYCRLHYIKNWRKIKRKEVILKEGKLNIYIEELVAKYPEKYLEAIRSDLTNDKEFAKVIHDLDLDESIDDFEGEGSDGDAVIDTIKREFDDDTETF